MLQFNPNDSGDTPYKIRHAVKESGLTLQQICERLKSDFGVKLTPSAFESFNISPDTSFAAGYGNTRHLWCE